MKMAGLRKSPLRGKLIALVIVLLAALLSFYAYHRTLRFPASDDASLDADLVHVASPVGGRIARIHVAENQLVAKGDVLFEIDPVPYQLAVDQARADLELAQATLGTRRRTIATEQATAAMASTRSHGPSRTTRSRRARWNGCARWLRTATCPGSNWTRRRWRSATPR